MLIETMKKLTLKSIGELAENHQLLTSLEMSSFCGGGDGTRENPYTLEEMDKLADQCKWEGGYVQYMGYVAPCAFFYGNYNGGQCTQYNATPADLMRSLVSNGLEQVAETLLGDLPLIGEPLSYIMQEMTDCRMDMLADISEAGYSGQDNVHIVMTKDSNSSNDLNYSYNAYNSNGEVICSYSFNMATGSYSKK